MLWVIAFALLFFGLCANSAPFWFGGGGMLMLAFVVELASRAPA